MSPDEIFTELMLMTTEQAQELSFTLSEYTMRFLYATKYPGAGSNKPIMDIYNSLAALSQSQIEALAKNISSCPTS